MPLSTLICRDKKRKTIQVPMYGRFAEVFLFYISTSTGKFNKKLQALCSIFTAACCGVIYRRFALITWILAWDHRQNNCTSDGFHVEKLKRSSHLYTGSISNLQKKTPLTWLKWEIGIGHMVNSHPLRFCGCLPCKEPPGHPEGCPLSWRFPAFPHKSHHYLELDLLASIKERKTK